MTQPKFPEIHLSMTPGRELEAILRVSFHAAVQSSVASMLAGLQLQGLGPMSAEEIARLRFECVVSVVDLLRAQFAPYCDISLKR